MLLIMFKIIDLFKIIGLVVGIALSLRTRSMPRNDYPFWRKLSKASWIVFLAGYLGGAPIQFILFAIAHKTNGNLPDFATILFNVAYFASNAAIGLTGVCPALWIAAWVRARRPEKITPPPPSIDPVDP